MRAKVIVPSSNLSAKDGQWFGNRVPRNNTSSTNACSGLKNIHDPEPIHETRLMVSRECILSPRERISAESSRAEHHKMEWNGGKGNAARSSWSIPRQSTGRRQLPDPVHTVTIMPRGGLHSPGQPFFRVAAFYALFCVKCTNRIVPRRSFFRGDRF